MRTKHQFFLCVFAVAMLVLAVRPLAAQGTDWYYNKPIKAVTFEGLKSIKASDLDGVTSSFISKEFTDELFADLLNRVFALDYFDDVSPQALPGDSNRSTVRIKLVVVEKPIIKKIVFSGNSRVRNADLKDAISIKEKDVFVQSKMLVDERVLRDLYITKGFTAAKISSSFVEEPDGITVTFKIDEGMLSVVKEIKFQGNMVVSARTLKRSVQTKEAGVFSKGSFQESQLESDKQAVVLYYRNRGYVDARVLDVLRETAYNENKKRDELTITFVVQEGSQYNFGGLSFIGNKVFTTEELDTLIRLKPGSLFNQTKFQESLQAVEDKYYENGYTSNQFNAEVSKDTDNKVVSYTLYITENPRSHIENIIIKGNTKTKDYVIRREISTEPGDIFSKAKLMSSLRNLYNLQYFSAIVPDVLQGSESNLVDLVFTVEEQSTTTLDFGFTFSGVSDPDDLPVALYAKVQDSNLFGEGRSVSAATTLSTTEQSVSLGYGQNWLWDQPISTGVSLGYSHSTNYSLRNKFQSDGSLNTSDYYMKYEQHQFNLSLSLGRRWVPDFAILTLAGGITGGLVNNIYDGSLYMPLDMSISEYNNNWAPKNSVYASFAMDGRNISYDPSSGWFFSEKLSWYGLLPKGILAFAPDWGETEFYLRSDTKAEKYFTLIDKPVSERWSFKLVFMVYTGLSLQFPLPDSIIKDTSKLYIDGMFNGRGWSVYNNSSARGKALFSNIAELRMPVIPGILSFDIFFDAIAVKPSADALFSDFTNENDWYFSFGPSLRFTIQQFPLRLLLANDFKIRDGNVVFMNKTASSEVAWYKNWNFVLSFNLTNR